MQDTANCSIKRKTSVSCSYYRKQTSTFHLLPASCNRTSRNRRSSRKPFVVFKNNLGFVFSETLSTLKERKAARAQRRREREMQRAAREAAGGAVEGENSQLDASQDAQDMQPRVREISTGRILHDDELPPPGELDAWLEKNPGRILQIQAPCLIAKRTLISRL